MHNFYGYPYYRGAQLPPPPPPKPPVPKKLAPKKINFKTLKTDTCKSLNDVEHFLCNFSDFVKYVKLINLLKK